MWSCLRTLVATACGTAVVSAGVAVSGVTSPRVASADDSSRYGFSGEYADARGLVDFGERWYDPRHQVFYAADPAPVDDPGVLGADARLTSSYSLNHLNALVYSDPDGRMPGKMTAPAIEADPEPLGYDGPGDLPADDLPVLTTTTNTTAITTTTSTTSTVTSMLTSTTSGYPRRDPPPPRIYPRFGPAPWWWLYSDGAWYEVNIDREHVALGTAQSMRFHALSLIRAGARCCGVRSGVVTWAQSLGRRGLLEVAKTGADSLGVPWPPAEPDWTDHEDHSAWPDQ